MDLCRKCDSWQIAAGDLYCGWCGAPLVKAEFGDLTRTVLLGTEPVATVETSVMIRNIGSLPLDVVVEATSSAVEVLQREYRLERNVRLPVVLRVHTGAEAGRGARITTNEPGEPPRYVTLRIERPARFHLETDEVRATAGGRGRIPVVLVHESGAAVQRLEARSSLPWLRPTAEPISLQPGGHAVIAHVDESAIGQPTTETVALDLFVEQVAAGSVPLRLIAERPALLISQPGPDGVDLSPNGPLMPGEVRRASLLLKNDGGRPLTIQSIQIKGEGWSRYTHRSVPASLMPDEAMQVELDAEADKLSEQEPARLLIDWLDGAENATLSLPLKAVKARRAFYPIGIDFGTTCSCVAVTDDGQTVKMVRLFQAEEYGSDDDEESAILPTAVAFPDRRDPSQYLAGPEALEASGGSSVVLVRDIKRRIERRERTVSVYGDQVPLEVVAGHYLRHLIGAAQKELGNEVTEVCVTVPAKFSPAQNSIIQRACERAGVAPGNVTLLDEPVAAALAYIQALMRTGRERSTIMVYDFGGGTLDLALLQVARSQVGWEIRVLDVDGDPRFGGTDLTKAVQEDMLGTLRRDLGPFPFVDPGIMASPEKRSAAHNNRKEIEDISELTKCNLSWREQFDPVITIYSGESPEPRPGTYQLNREGFEALPGVGDKIVDSIQLVREVLDSNELTPADVDKLILSGRSTQVPMVRRKLEEMFGEAKVESVPNLKTCVAQGAVLWASSRNAARRQGESVQHFRLDSRTTSRYGLHVPDVPFGFYFQEVVPKGRDYPAEGEFPRDAYDAPLALVDGINRFFVCQNFGRYDRVSPGSRALVQLQRLTVTCSLPPGVSRPVRFTMTVRENKQVFCQLFDLETSEEIPDVVMEEV